MNDGSTLQLTSDEILDQCKRSLLAQGASEAHASSLARATLIAEAEGNRAVGLLHLLDYLQALADGRLAGDVIPSVERVTPVVTRVDAHGGMQHLGIDLVFDDVVAAARELGLAAVSSRNGFTVGALSYFTRRLAEQGLVALAFANAAPPVMPASGGTRARFCTNPMAFAVPLEDGNAIVIDQSSTATALVAVKQAADRGERIPEGWALGPDGEPTTDPAQALAGVLLPFGGARGANIALMVELMAAGLTGADWSCDSAPFNDGERHPSLGYFLVAIDPERTAGPGFRERVTRYVRLLEQDGAYVPGLGKGVAAARAAQEGVAVDAAVWDRIRQYAAGTRENGPPGRQ